MPLWTGRVVVLVAKGGAAVYDPAADRWAPSCCGPYTGLIAEPSVWTGAVVLLLSSSDPDIGGAAFTPP